MCICVELALMIGCQPIGPVEGIDLSVAAGFAPGNNGQQIQMVEALSFLIWFGSEDVVRRAVKAMVSSVILRLRARHIRRGKEVHSTHHISLILHRSTLN